MSHETPYAYPIRTSEYLTVHKIDKDITPLNLSESEKEKVLAFEAELFDKLKPILDIKNTGIHSVFPGYFATKEGWSKFKEIYGTANPEVLKEEKPNDVKEATHRFFKLKNLKDIPVDKRESLHDKSTSWAKDSFAESFVNANEDTNKVANPIRVAQVPDPQALVEKTKLLRGLKAEIKDEAKMLADDSEIDKAKKIVLDIYRRHINVKIAGCLEAGVVIKSHPDSNNFSDILNELKPHSSNANYSSDMFSRKNSLKTLERIDHFLQGVGTNFDNRGNFSTIPSTVSKHIEGKSQVQRTDQEKEKYSKWEEVRVDATKAKQMAEEALSYYGLLKSEDNPNGWKIVVKESRSSLSVRRMREGVVVNELNIPANFNRNYVDAVRTLSHEIEGHIIRHANRELLPLKLLQEYSTGRGDDLSEAAAVWVEEETMKKGFGVERSVKGIYYWALKERQKGLSFKRCYKKVLEVLPDTKDKYKEAFRKTLRIFEGGKIPLSNRSGRIPNSEELAYHEPTAELLKNDNLEKLLFIPGIDIYSAEDLFKLGLIDINEVKVPKFVFAEKSIY